MVSEDKVEFSGAVVDVDKDAVTVLQVIKSKIKFNPDKLYLLAELFAVMVELPPDTFTDEFPDDDEVVFSSAI